MSPWIETEQKLWYVKKWSYLKISFVSRITAKGSDIFPLFRISFYWYTFLAALICICTGLIVSYLTEINDPPVPKRFLSPVIHCFLSKDRKEDETKYKSIEEIKRQLSIDERLTDEEELKDRLRKLSYISETFDD